jgi:hypothetical protein
MEKMMVSHDAWELTNGSGQYVRVRSAFSVLGRRVAADFDAWGTRMISDDGIFEYMLLSCFHLPVQ